MDVVHGFAGIALVPCASWKDAAVSRPKGTTANHVLSRLREGPEETALAAAVAAFGESFASVQSSFLQRSPGTAISNENDSQEEPDLGPAPERQINVSIVLSRILELKLKRLGPAPFLAQRSDKERISPAKTIRPAWFLFNGGRGNNPNIQFPVSSSRYTFKSESLGISGKVSYLLEKQTKKCCFLAKKPKLFISSLSLFFPFLFFVLGLFLSSKARRTR